MDENSSSSRDRTRNPFGRILWLLVIVLIVVLWWWFRTDRDRADELAEAADPAALAASDPDDILIDLVDGASPDTVAAIERELAIDLELVDDSGVAEATKLYRAHVDPARRDELIAALAARPEVEIAEPDAEMSLFPGEQVDVAVEPEPASPGYPNDPLYKKQWHLRQIGMPEAWKLSDGKGVIVAVLDTGVAFEDYRQFKLIPDLVGVTFVKPYDFVGKSKHANDDHGHGSHVAGTIAQATNNGIGVAGVAPGVRIMPLKVLSGSGSGSVAGIADAIRYAADNGAKVMNMSLGGAFPSAVLKKAVAYAHDKGVVVVCAAGNDGRGKVSYPAAYPGAVAIAATNQSEATTFYSNWGKEIDVAAPGGQTRDRDGSNSNPDGGVWQNTIKIGDPTQNDYLPFMGTSMASPHAAAVAALIVGEGVSDPKRVEQILKDTARKPKDHKYDRDHYGAGIIDAPAAIKAARSASGGGVGALALALALAGAVAASARRSGLGTALGWRFLGGVVAGSSGLFFLGQLVPDLATLPVIGALTRGLPSWDMSLLGPTGHGNWLFFSALIPLALIAVGYGVAKLRGLLAGLAIGVAAHLLYFAVVPVTMVDAPLGSIGWLVGNAAVCLWLARVALRR